MSWFSKKRCKKIKHLENIIGDLKHEIYIIESVNQDLLTINDEKQDGLNIIEADYEAKLKTVIDDYHALLRKFDDLRYKYYFIRTLVTFLVVGISLYVLF